MTIKLINIEASQIFSNLLFFCLVILAYTNLQIDDRASSARSDNNSSNSNIDYDNLERIQLRRRNILSSYCVKMSNRSRDLLHANIAKFEETYCLFLIKILIDAFVSNT